MDELKLQEDLSGKTNAELIEVIIKLLQLIKAYDNQSNIREYLQSR